MRISLPITWAPWVAVLVGLVLLAIGLWQVMDAWEASSWPTTSGTVIESRVATHRSGRSTSHHASIHYRYNAGGIDYTGDRVEFGGSQVRGQGFQRHSSGWGLRDEAQFLVERYPLGATVTVYYDPAQPSSAVLSTEAGPYSWIKLLGGLLLCIGGGVFYVILPMLLGSREDEDALLIS